MMKKRNIAVTLLGLRNRFTFQSVKYYRHCGIVCVSLLSCSLVRAKCVVSRTAWLTCTGLGSNARLSDEERPIRMSDRIRMHRHYELRIFYTWFSFFLPHEMRHEKSIYIIYAVRLSMYIQYEFIRDIYSLNMKITYGKYGFVANTYNQFI